MVSYWSLSDSKSPQVYRTLLRILADLSNAVVRLVSTRPLISKSSSPSTNPLVTVPRAPVITGITVTVMFHSLFQFPSKVQVFIRFYFINLFFCFLSILLSGQQGLESLQFGKFSFFLSIFYFFFLSLLGPSRLNIIYYERFSH